MEKYFINGKDPVVEGKSKKIYELDKDTFFMCFKPHLRSITSKIVKEQIKKDLYQICIL